MAPSTPIPTTSQSQATPDPQLPTIMSDSDLTILCWILGDQYEHIFGVEISRNKIVHALKYAIKAENPNTLKGIDARSLTLYSVAIPSTQLAEHAAALSGQ